MTAKEWMAGERKLSDMPKFIVWRTDEGIYGEFAWTSEGGGLVVTDEECVLGPQDALRFADWIKATFSD